MKLTNLISMVALGLSLSACKQIAFQDVVSLEGTCSEVDENSGECTLNIYTGQTDSIEYFNGGWFGPYPNYRAKLLLEVKSNALIAAHLETPKCKAVGEVSVLDFAKLDQLIRSSDLGIGQISPVDGGDEVLTVSNGSKETEYYLKNGDNSQGEIVIKNPTEVRLQVNKIIEALEEKHCGSVVPESKLETLVYELLYPVYNGPTPASEDIAPPHNQKTVTITHLKMALNSSERGSMSIQFTVTNQFNSCTQNIEADVSNELRELAKKVEVREVDNICARAAMVGPIHAIPQVSLYYSGSSTPVVGYVGCERSRQAINIWPILEKVKALALSKASCGDSKVID